MKKTKTMQAGVKPYFTFPPHYIEFLLLDFFLVHLTFPKYSQKITVYGIKTVYWHVSVDMSMTAAYIPIE